MNYPIKAHKEYNTINILRAGNWNGNNKKEDHEIRFQLESRLVLMICTYSYRASIKTLA